MVCRAEVAGYCKDAPLVRFVSAPTTHDHAGWISRHRHGRGMRAQVILLVQSAVQEELCKSRKMAGSWILVSGGGKLSRRKARNARPVLGMAKNKSEINTES